MGGTTASRRRAGVCSDLYDRQMSWASSEGVRRSMQSNRGKDTKLELRVRRALHALGLRYRLQRKVPGSNRRTIDVAFPRQRVAVFIDGCFWHGCPTHHTVARTNGDYWAAKVARNRQRDQDTDRLLAEAGWTSARFWEHQSTEEIVDRIVRLVRSDDRNEGA
jgi:DNA mismatch endonuclease (patch repair protein)